MADMIKCPTCGENNFPDQEFCQFCQSRLRPVVDSSKGGSEGFKPGQVPTQKVTADLEPVLPQWLREARDTARNTANDDIMPGTISPQEPQRPPAAKADLLAGLQAQSAGDEEEDVPDWLASITGATPSSKKTQGDASEAHRIELGGKKQPAQKESAPESETPSWLANLSSSGTSSPEKDELTDWMREASGVKPQQPPSPSKPEPAASDTPDWLRSLAMDGDQQTNSDSFTPADEPFNATPSSDTPDWLRQMAVDDGTQNSGLSSFTPAEEPFNATPSSDTPDWLRQMAVDDGTQNSGPSSFTPAEEPFNVTPSSDTPDWLRQMAVDDGTQNSVPSSFTPANEPFNATPSSDTPDWLRQMAVDDGTQNSGPSSFTPADEPFDAASSNLDTPDWLSSLGSQDQGQSGTPAVFSDSSSSKADAGGETLDWLKGLDSPAPSPSLSSDDDWLKSFQTEKSEPPAEADDVPSWLKSDEPVASAPNADMELPSWLSGTPAATPAAPASMEEEFSAPDFPAQDEIELGDVPSWLKAAAPRSSIYGDSLEEQPSAQQMPEASSPSAPADSADWLNAFKSLDDPKPTAFPVDEPANATPPPAFVPDSQHGEDMDALFTDMPDWLAGSVDVPPVTAPSPTPITNTDALAAGELPAWVQAMRPVDTGISQLSSTLLSSDQTLEERGALAGLQGVLPAAPGYGPTSKPKAYSIKLQASDEQQTHAALLEQILTAEAEPVPIASYSALKTSRSLRWTIAFILLVTIFAALVMRTQIFTMPVGNTLEINGALQAVASIPEGAPVLVAFDYEAARIGEMEAAAAPLFDQMLLLHHPRMTFISTNETGGTLAERFIAGPLADHSYESGISYLNLGYLPGGSMGIRAFAQNPVVAAPSAFSQSANILDATLVSAWTLPPLEGVSSLSQFAAMILITDNADSARAWIEQTTSARGAVPFIVISSAQAAPMLQPYFASKQISGLVSGLYGGAVYEQNNAGRPGTARIYWDGYSIGMLLAMILILGGGLWNLALGLRDRAAAREAK